MEQERRKLNYHYHLDGDDDYDGDDRGKIGVLKCGEIGEKTGSNPLKLLADVALYVSIHGFCSAACALKKLPKHCKKKRTSLSLGPIDHHRPAAAATHKVKIKKLKTQDSVFAPCNKMDDDHHKQANKNRKRKRPNNSDCHANKKKPKLVGEEIEAPPRDLPDLYKNKIRDIGGVDYKLVIQKSLTSTDVSEGHGRLSIPVNQVRNLDFLTDQEIDKFRKQKKRNGASVEVVVLDTRLELKTGLSLRRWDMQSNSIYALATEWKSLFQSNGIGFGTLIQVWSFRVNGRLHLAIVKISEGEAVKDEAVAVDDDAADKGQYAGAS